MNAPQVPRIPWHVISLQVLAMMVVLVLANQWIDNRALNWTVCILLGALLPIGIGELYRRKRKQADQRVVPTAPPSPWPPSAELVSKLSIDRRPGS